MPSAASLRGSPPGRGLGETLEGMRKEKKEATSRPKRNTFQASLCAALYIPIFL